MIEDVSDYSDGQPYLYTYCSYTEGGKEFLLSPTGLSLVKAQSSMELQRSNNATCRNDGTPLERPDLGLGAYQCYTSGSTTESVTVAWPAGRDDSGAEYVGILLVTVDGTKLGARTLVSKLDPLLDRAKSATQ